MSSANEWKSNLATAIILKVGGGGGCWNNWTSSFDNEKINSQTNRCCEGTVEEDMEELPAKVFVQEEDREEEKSRIRTID